ncbi:uncharacterized protein LOC110696804 [Chenopodium quinoa]|uniref:uncharacterized protein LOC110696804 n=1 Tax=Chenopodium quinoa TaxID=63459 RepID=UPI000B790F3E|nr:uncharacterized protein LOC110696804 [Chenopodium quinoa]
MEFFESDCFGMHQLYEDEQRQWDYYSMGLHDSVHDESELETEQQNGEHADGGYDVDVDEIHIEIEGTPIEEGHGRRANRELTLEEKRQLVDEILVNMEGDLLPFGFLSKMARKHNVHRSTTTRWFQVIKKHLGEGTTEMSYVAALHMSSSVIHRLKKKGRLRTHTSTNHPSLTDNHKIARLKWVLSYVHPVPSVGNPNFRDMKHTIHIDEKWFYLNPETRTFYLLPNEDNPYRAQQSRRFKLKAMFMGMFGLFPFVKYDIAKKTSKNRAKGTLETKVVQSVNKDAIRDMLLNHVIPAIHEKWPPHLPKDILIQWDNAKPHQVPKDTEFTEACHAYGFNIEFVYQPAQSLDLNVLDLGVFRVIQSIQYQSFPKSLDELLERVKEAWEGFDPIVNKYTWITLQSFMLEILERKGNKKFVPPHVKKRHLDSLGQLQTCYK